MRKKKEDEVILSALVTQAFSAYNARLNCAFDEIDRLKTELEQKNTQIKNLCEVVDRFGGQIDRLSSIVLTDRHVEEQTDIATYMYGESHENNAR